MKVHPLKPYKNVSLSEHFQDKICKTFDTTTPKTWVILRFGPIQCYNLSLFMSKYLLSYNVLESKYFAGMSQLYQCPHEATAAVNLNSTLKWDGERTDG